MKLGNGMKVKEEYFNILEEALEGYTDVEEALEFVYSLYEETLECYKKSHKFFGYTKKTYIKTFIRLYECLGDLAYQINHSTFIKCVSILLDNPEYLFTEDFVEEQNQSVWDVFVDNGII